MSKIYQTIVRRDAQTITPVVIPKHEAAILKEIFGDENVTVGAAAGDWNPGEQEYDRLTRKYGPEVVARVYGTKASGGFDAAMERANGSEKTAKQDKKAAEKD